MRRKYPKVKSNNHLFSGPQQTCVYTASLVLGHRCIAAPDEWSYKPTICDCGPGNPCGLSWTHDDDCLLWHVMLWYIQIEKIH